MLCGLLLPVDGICTSSLLQEKRLLNAEIEGAGYEGGNGIVQVTRRCSCLPPWLPAVEGLRAAPCCLRRGRVGSACWPCRRLMALPAACMRAALHVPAPTFARGSMLRCDYGAQTAPRRTASAVPYWQVLDFVRHSGSDPPQERKVQVIVCLAPLASYWVDPGCWPLRFCCNALHAPAAKHWCGGGGMAS